MEIKIEITAVEAIPIIKKYILEHFQFADENKADVFLDEDQEGDDFYWAYVKIPEGKKSK